MRNGILQLGDVGRDPNEAGDFEHCSEGCVSSEEAVAPPPAPPAEDASPPQRDLLSFYLCLEN